MVSLFVLNYTVAPELVHRLHRDHNAAFRDAVDKVLPDYQKQVSWLKHYEAGMKL
ncbi:TPA: YgjP-like metallopeptidase domain-containing protein [Aeromonas veronii]|jgi:predicted metal-dependent hydrolase